MKPNRPWSATGTQARAWIKPGGVTSWGCLILKDPEHPVIPVYVIDYVSECIKGYHQSDSNSISGFISVHRLDTILSNPRSCKLSCQKQSQNFHQYQYYWLLITLQAAPFSILWFRVSIILLLAVRKYIKQRILHDQTESTFFSWISSSFSTERPHCFSNYLFSYFSPQGPRG